MADEIKYDFSQVTQLAADLGNVSKELGPFLRSAIEFTSVEIKKAANSKLTGYWKGARGSIDYDVTVAASGAGSSLKSEIGYNKGRHGGALGNLREFGAPNAPDVIFTHKNGKLVVVPIPGTSKPRPPHKDLANALDANKADFVKGLNLAAKDAEKKAGL